MKISQSGIELIKRFEGLRLDSYDDGVGVWTIGYGHTSGVQPGQSITQEQADQFLRDDLEWVETCIERHVKTPLSQPQYDALCSLIYNIGAGAFSLSTLLKKLNAGDMAGASEQFARWNRGGGRVLDGLTRRRAAERALFDQTTQEARPMIPIAGPILAALLPEIIKHIPLLNRVPEPMQGAAVQVITEALGAPNAQAAAQALAEEPEAVQVATEAVKENWLELTEAGGGGIEGARKADAAVVAAGGRVLDSPSFVVACLLLPLVYLIVGNVAGLYGAEWSPDARAGLAGSVAGGIVMGLIGYYYGQTTSRNRTPAP